MRMPVTYFQRSNQQKNTRSPFRVRSHWIKNHATQIDPAHGSKRGELITSINEVLVLTTSHFRCGTDYQTLDNSLTWPDHISVFHNLYPSPLARY